MHFEPGVDLDCHVRFDMSYTGGPPATADLTAYAEGVMSAFATTLAGLLVTTDSCFDVYAQDLADTSTVPGSYLEATAGTREGTAVPNSITVLLNKQPDRSYRGSKPKNFLPFGVDADILNTFSWSTGLVDEVNGGWGEFIATLSGETYGGITIGQEVCVSYWGPPTVVNTGGGRNRYHSTLREPPLVRNILSTGASQVFGSQRRRIRAS